MKKLFIFVIAVVLAASVMTVGVSAAEELEIKLTADNFGSTVGSTTADQLQWNDDGTVTAVNIPLFGLALPQTVYDGDTVVVHIVGTSDDDFRVWLLGGAEATCSNQYKMSENGFEGGEFDKAIEFTFQDYDSKGLTEAVDICIKGPAYGTNLVNVTITSLSIAYCTMEEYESGALDESQTLIDDATAAVDAVFAALEADDATFNAARDSAQALIDELTAKGELGFTSIADTASLLADKLDDAIDERLLVSLQSYVDIVEDAYASAKAAGNDAAKLEEYLATASEASSTFSKAGIGYVKVSAKARELKALIAEIEGWLADAKAAPQTEAPADTGADDGEKKSGCGSSMGAAAVIVAITSTLGFAVVKKH